MPRIDPPLPKISDPGDLVVGRSGDGKPEILPAGNSGERLRVTGDGSLGWESDVGPAGPTGPQGATGPLGAPTGPTGLKGDTGATGVTGPAGLTGPSGPTGAASSTIGPTGPQGGTLGVTGPVGPTSTVPGPQGPAGPVGADSTVTGPTGRQGPQGALGSQGYQGTAGPAGPKGDQGVTGPLGVTGPSASPSIYDLIDTESFAAGNAGVSFQDCFRAEYQTYLITVSGVPLVSTPLWFRLSSGSLPDMTNTYVYVGFTQETGSTNPAGRDDTNALQWIITGQATTNSELAAEILVFNPYDPGLRTQMMSRCVTMSTANHATQSHYSGFNKQTRSFDGFVLILSSGTAGWSSGAVRVYGMRS